MYDNSIPLIYYSVLSRHFVTDSMLHLLTDTQSCHSLVHSSVKKVKNTRQFDSVIAYAHDSVFSNTIRQYSYADSFKITSTR